MGTIADLHMGIREAVRGSSLTTFMLGCHIIELHPGRVTIDWSLSVTSVSPPLYFRSGDPMLVLAWIKAKVASEAIRPPRQLEALGDAPQAEDEGA